uniref:Dolichyl-diphosphooligosaccharide-protein glycosyltransferase subunit TMEM258 n=1 Tax=Wuchereria bancrofti TaxID=6293 RepID=A0A1I8EMI8_WUCBA
MTADLLSMERYVGPVNPSLYSQLAVLLLAIGLFFMAWFFVYEVTSSKFTRVLIKELLISSVAALFLGFGSRKDVSKLTVIT